MSDTRPWAKIDTGYMFNPKWFQIERELRTKMANSMASAMASANGKTDKLPEVCHSVCHEVAISNALRCAREAHLASILYSAQNQTDGVFPVRAIKSLAGVQTEPEELAITALFSVGMWRNLPGGMAEVRDYLEHQTPASLTKTRSEAGRKGAKARWQNNGKSHQVANGKTMAKANAEEKRREEKLIADFDAWYQAYPKKVGKGDALKAFKAALKKTDLETLISTTKRYATSMQGQDAKYIKNPGPWLRDERWSDETLTTTVKAYDPWEVAS